MPNNINELTHGKHQIYYNYQDYQRIQKGYHSGKITNLDPYSLLICAKANLVLGEYKNCLKILDKVRIDHSTKILYERQALLIKAAYLNHDENWKNNVKRAYQDFEYYKLKCPGYKILNIHNYQIDKLRKKALIDNQRINFDDQQKKKLKKQLKDIQKTIKFAGTSSYLVSKRWYDKFQQYINKNNEQYPGPITNFQIINHIFQYQSTEQPNKKHLKHLLFPVIQFQHYYVFNKQYWNKIKNQFGGNTVQRILVSDVHNNQPIGGDTTVKTLISIKGQQIIMQWQQGLFWQYSVIPVLCENVGLGQLKILHQNNYYTLVEPGLIQQKKTKYKYILTNLQQISCKTEHQKMLKEYLVRKYDMEYYELGQSLSHGIIGLWNLGNTCYMNATLQCLSQLHRFSEYFIKNRHLSELNISQQNIDGSFGEIACAFADIIKKMWFCCDRAPYVNPKLFKDAFSDRFKDFHGYKQQDAQQFLIFLLNCLHDDLNTKSDSLKQSTLKESVKNIKEAQDRMISQYYSRNSSIIVDNFVGFHSTVIKCEKCHKETYQFEHFFMFQVQLPHIDPSMYLYVFMKHQKPETPIKIQVHFQELKTFAQVFQALKDQLRIIMDASLHGFILDDNYHIVSSIKQQDKVQQIHHEYTKVKGKTFYFYIYVLEPLQKDEQFALINFYYKDQLQNQVVALPRIIPIQNNLKLPQNQHKLLKYIAKNALPPNGLFDKSRKDQLQSLQISNTKGKLYKTKIKVQARERLRQYNYKQYKKFIGMAINKIQISLQSCLIKMSQSERIDLEQGWRCGKCKQVREAMKTDKIFVTPDILIFHLKRFSRNNKIHTKIDYPINDFDITPFIGDKKQRKIYDLIGVIVHLGSLNSGHYKSYCRNYKDNSWYIYDDHSVQPISEQYVISQNAYILFYKRK